MNTFRGYAPNADARRLTIKPQSFYIEQRREALEMASHEHGCGVAMEVYSSYTIYWAEPRMHVGEMEVYVSRAYAGMPEFETVLRTEKEQEEWNLWTI